MHKKTKILATLGPATSTEEILKKLVKSGMSAVRLNFSHGTYEDHKKNTDLMRKIEAELNLPISIVQDLHGPKVQLGTLLQDPIMLTPNQHITLFHGLKQNNNLIPVPMNIFAHLEIGDKILINDGLICLRVEKLTNNQAQCIVIAGGEVRSNKGVNLPDTHLPNLFLTDRDRKDIEYGIELKVDYIAVSFVQDANDIQTVRNLIDRHKHKPKIIAKIETAAAVRNLDSIIEISDSIMVARGDLAAEVGQEEVPVIQRTIVSLARKHNKPVIIATQMLESMINNSEPTRAEVNDVASAVLDEVDTVMLSAETAVGSFPLETIIMMDKIIKRVEKYFLQVHKNIFELSSPSDYSDQTTAIAAAACLLARQLKAKKILALTASGKTAIRISSYRPLIPVSIITDNLLVCRQLALVWGIKPYYFPKIEDNNLAYSELVKQLELKHEINKGDKIVQVTGTHPGRSGHTNIISVTSVGEK